jgi:hypothetical protein
MEKKRRGGTKKKEKKEKKVRSTYVFTSSPSIEVCLTRQAF